ncbi:uncharacterized protein LOC129585480 isoform X2 [Paramacrobiotus metropolitanus]|uniref:uncharacterized protein LOC129585480 isoform X2 n=1 Tax=Paramacrobiotus metropolitanus TaxID=2943436 RepID=UPI002445FC3D|nr:uncharacterized protein LOC129585480 isoform X2 [Paramacrobiotus metropolitanus]XP_055334153.1 uncharacterized protein LOC129585480 isoform X2 [Paramacrobiotus metropolitanus]
MKRQRAIPSSLPTGISVTSARPVLRASTKFNQIVPASPAAMSYKDLVKVVGVDPESNPSYWRKAIDHSAETVVFFQVDLRGILPRMCKSVRICQAEENQQLLLVPSVYIGDTLLSGSYVKTIIGKRFLADEDDLMKLLEHAGILQENEELAEDKEENRATAEGDEDTGENYMFVAEPVAKKMKQREKRDLTANAQWDSESDSALPGVPGDWPGRSKTPPKKLRQQEKRKTQASATTAPRITRARSAHTTAENDATGSAPVHGRRQPIDLNALFVPDAVDAEASSRHANASLSQEDTPMESDYDTGGLPVADEDNDEFALGFDAELPGPSTADDTGDGAVDSPEVNEPVDGSGHCGSGSASGTSVKPRKPAPHHTSTSEPSDGTARLSMLSFLSGSY